MVFATFMVAKAMAQPSFAKMQDLETVCYGSGVVNRIYIPPPAAFLQTKGSGNAQIEVVYLGFPPAPRDAFEFAIGIWESLLNSNIKIRINAVWTPMSEPGVLGSTSTNGFYKGSFIGAHNPDAYYAVAVAEKIADKQLNDVDDFEIDISFNSTAAWYYGIDGETPTSNYDFVTVVIHELCHGLGFADSFNTTATLGSYGLNGIPVIYDTFVEEESSRKRLTNTSNFQNPSAELRTALLSNALNFAGPVTVLYNSRTRPALYAPGIWSSGSSISHLNEATTLQVNALMTPFVGKGEAIHDPGKLTLSILADVGWIHTNLEHTHLKDSENNLSEVSIPFSIQTDTLLKKNSIKVYYSYNSSSVYDSVIVSSSINGGSFNALIPVPAYNTRINYYIAVSDTFGRVYQSPTYGKKEPTSIFIGADIIKPVITHRPLKFILTGLDTLILEAEITDNLSSLTASLEYKFNNGPIVEVPMVLNENDEYYAYILTDQFTFTGTDTIHYRIIASDAALVPNIAYAPLSGFYKVPVFSLYEPVENYFNAFKAGDTDFLRDGFYIDRPIGFDNYALHTKHPYESSELEDKTFDYYAILRHPIIIDSSGLFLTFKEIVLVEPGEPGSAYGSEDFFDYVVVEVSKDGGKSWTPLVDGYDSRANVAWETAYNSAILEQNSIFIGNPQLFIQRTISLDTTSFLDAGDVLVLRFRLFSDPFAHGWGWAIDDLFIKSITSASEKVKVSTAKLWPNPGNGIFTLDLGSNPASIGTSLKISDFNGRLIKRIQNLKEQSVIIDISGRPDGIYYIILESGGIVSSVKYLLINN